MFIYALCEPETLEVRYVGKASDPQVRYRRHLQPSELKPETHRTHWIRELLANEQRPALVILEEVKAERWQERERYWIEFYLAQGARLVNTAEGGQGGKTCERERLVEAFVLRSGSQTWRARIGEASRQRWQDPDYRANRIASLTGHTVSEEARRRIGDASRQRGTVHLQAPDIRKRANAKTNAKRTPEERSASATRGWACKTPEERLAIIRRGIANRRRKDADSVRATAQERGASEGLRQGAQ